LRVETQGYYIVCEYYPVGNVGGDNNQYYKDNVKKQIKGKPTDTVETGVTSASWSFRVGEEGPSEFPPTFLHIVLEYYLLFLSNQYLTSTQTSVN
jgi:hypothetical protein